MLPTKNTDKKHIKNYKKNTKIDIQIHTTTISYTQTKYILIL